MVYKGKKGILYNSQGMPQQKKCSYSGLVVWSFGSLGYDDYLCIRQAAPQQNKDDLIAHGLHCLCIRHYFKIRINHTMKRLVLPLFLTFAFLHAAAQSVALQGKRMAVIGDSYVRNHQEPVENTWHWKFAQKHGMTYLNYGRNGACVSMDRTRFGKALCHRYMEMADSLDLIIIIAGHNDAALLDSIGLDLYREKCAEVCRGLIERYPEARICWFTPWCNDNPHFKMVVDATIETCGDYGIPVFDAYRNSNIFARNEAFRKLYFQKGKNDRAHLNDKGHDRFLPLAEEFILRMF